jgi:hypothetical protein
MSGPAETSTRRRLPLLLAASLIVGTIGWALVHPHASHPPAGPAASSSGPGAQAGPPQGFISPTGAAGVVGTAVTTPPATSTTTITTRPPDPPATVAAQIAERYLSAPPASRAAACKNSAGDNICTADLAATLAAPGWAGGGGTAAPGPVTIVGTVASDVTATAIGYEIRATVSGQVVAVLVRVVRTADGRWLASTLQETS